MAIKKKQRPCKKCGKPSYTPTCTYCSNGEKMEKARKAERKPIVRKPMKTKVKKKAPKIDKTGVKKLPKNSILQKHTDDIYSIKVRLRDSDISGWAKCVTCDKICFFFKDCIQNGHFRSRAKNSTRYHDQNNHGQCSGCNGRGHGMYFEYGRELDKRYGEGTADQVHSLSLVSRSMKGIDYIEVIQQSVTDALLYLKDKRFDPPDYIEFDGDLKEFIRNKIMWYQTYINKL